MHVHACGYLQESLRLAHLSPPLPPRPAGGSSSEPHSELLHSEESDLSDTRSDDEADQLSRLLQVGLVRHQGLSISLLHSRCTQTCTEAAAGPHTCAKVLPDAGSAGGRSLPPGLLFTPTTSAVWRRRPSSGAPPAATPLQPPQLGKTQEGDPSQLPKAMSTSTALPLRTLLAATLPVGRLSVCTTKAEHLFESVRSRAEGINVHRGPFRWMGGWETNPAETIPRVQ